MNKTKKSIKIVIISNYDLYGGSSIAAYNLHTTLLKNGYKSLMIVQNKISNNPTIIQKENRINVTTRRDACCSCVLQDRKSVV